jgi:hypothetical protein
MDNNEESPKRPHGELEKHLTSKRTWLRLVTMVLFAIIFIVATWLAAAIVVLQFLVVLVTGDTNSNLQSLGSSMGIYLHNIVDYLSYNNDDLPFPFADWPDASRTDD